MTQEKDQALFVKDSTLVEGQITLRGFEPSTLSIRQGEVVVVPKDFLTSKSVEVQITR